MVGVCGSGGGRLLTRAALWFRVCGSQSRARQQAVIRFLNQPPYADSYSGDIHPRIGIGHVRVAAHIMVREWEVPEQGAVVVAKPVAEIVSNSPLLADAGHRFDF